MKMPASFIDETENINVIIETPAGTASKYVYDPELSLFRLKKILPKGIVFPCHFGFIPHTKGQDGDPLDVMVFMEEPSYPGCLVECRILGFIEAEEKTREGIRRNDRIIAAPLVAKSQKKPADFLQFENYQQDEIINFLIAYTALSEKEFRPLHKRGRQAGLELVRKHTTNGMD